MSLTLVLLLLLLLLKIQPQQPKNVNTPAKLPSPPVPYDDNAIAQVAKQISAAYPDIQLTKEAMQKIMSVQAQAFGDSGILKPP